jgi:hypothetical protein
LVGASGTQRAKPLFLLSTETSAKENISENRGCLWADEKFPSESGRMTEENRPGSTEFFSDPPAEKSRVDENRSGLPIIKRYPTKAGSTGDGLTEFQGQALLVMAQAPSESCCSMVGVSRWRRWPPLSPREPKFLDEFDGSQDSTYNCNEARALRHLSQPLTFDARVAEIRMRKRFEGWGAPL